MPQETINRNQFANQFQTVLLIFAMAAILGLTGFFLFGSTGFFVAMGLMLFGIAFSGRASASLILRMYKAQPIVRHQAPQLIDLFESICQRANLETIPRLYYIPSQLPNAFAAGTGRSASVAVTDGLIRVLTPRELSGVLAHEVAHIVNRDICVMTTADSITRTTSMISRFGLFAMIFSLGGMVFGSNSPNLLLGGMVMFIAPSVVVALQLAVSRTREFNADQGAAEITRDPYGLAAALSKLDRPKPKGIFERILRPGIHRKEPAMLRTHPPTEERVDKLIELAKLFEAQQSPSQIGSSSQPLVIENQPLVSRTPRYHVISGIWR